MNRRLRVLEVESARPGDEIAFEGKPVGRVTSAVSGFALGYVRVEVPDGARVMVGGNDARLGWPAQAPVAQGIERCPAEAEVARSNRAGRK